MFVIIKFVITEFHCTLATKIFIHYYVRFKVWLNKSNQYLKLIKPFKVYCEVHSQQEGNSVIYYSINYQHKFISEIKCNKNNCELNMILFILLLLIIFFRNIFHLFSKQKNGNEFFTFASDGWIGNITK